MQPELAIHLTMMTADQVEDFEARSAIIEEGCKISRDEADDLAMAEMLRGMGK